MWPQERRERKQLRHASAHRPEGSGPRVRAARCCVTMHDVVHLQLFDHSPQPLFLRTNTMTENMTEKLMTQ